eukprot:scaffold282584_cov35-Tisochrysis_lutea.AAC.1
MVRSERLAACVPHQLQRFDMLSRDLDASLAEKSSNAPRNLVRQLELFHELWPTFPNLVLSASVKDRPKHRARGGGAPGVAVKAFAAGLRLKRRLDESVSRRRHPHESVDLGGVHEASQVRQLKLITQSTQLNQPAANRVRLGDGRCDEATSHAHHRCIAARALLSRH